MLDFEDTTSESNTLSKSMSMSFMDSDITDQDLSNELELILSDDDIEAGFLRQPVHKLPPLPDNLRPLPDQLPPLPDKLPPLPEEEDIACAAQSTSTLQRKSERTDPKQEDAKQEHPKQEHPKQEHPKQEHPKQEWAISESSSYTQEGGTFDYVGVG